MTTGAIIVLVFGAWAITGLIVKELANRAGYLFGYYPGDGLLCQAWIVLQFPAVLIQYLWLDSWDYVHRREPPMSGAVVRMLWLMLKEPHLSPDDASERLEKADR